MPIDPEDAAVIAMAVRDDLLERLSATEARMETDAKESASKALLVPARTVLTEALSRLFTKESKQAERAARPKSDFFAWQREFHPKHRELVEQELTAPLQLLTTLGLKRDPAEVARKLCEASAEDLRGGYDTMTATAFGAWLAEWPTKRAAEFAEKIIKGD